MNTGEPAYIHTHIFKEGCYLNDLSGFLIGLFTKHLPEVHIAVSVPHEINYDLNKHD